MTLDAQNQSVHDSHPVELFIFEGPLETYRYTNYEEELTFEGHTYLPLVISRNDIAVGTSINENQSLNISVPFDSDVAIDHGYLQSPSHLKATVYRAEILPNGTVSGEQIWEGDSQAFAMNGLYLSITTQTNAIGLNAQLIGAYYQKTCNFKLYDSQTCKASRSENTETGEVLIVGPSAITVDDDGFGDHELKLGEATNQRTGEKRLIVENLVNVVTLAYGFTDVVVGDSIDFTRGCRHNTSDCKDVFDNIINFGGFIFIPQDTPLNAV